MRLHEIPGEFFGFQLEVALPGQALGIYIDIFLV